jgi:hypothetical protein
MPDARINVPMTAQEFSALLCMARQECRHPREQMRYLLREAAQQRGLLKPQDQQPQEGEGL